jgi:hypothetical protein
MHKTPYKNQKTSQKQENTPTKMRKNDKNIKTIPSYKKGLIV